MLVIRNQQGTTAIFEELRYLIRVISRIEGDRRAARSNDAQIRGHPARVVVGKNRNPRTWFNPACDQPCSERLSHPAKLGVGVTLDAFRSLNFNRDILRPAFSAFDKAVVESGHQCGKYTTRCNSLSAIIAKCPLEKPFSGRLQTELRRRLCSMMLCLGNWMLMRDIGDCTLGGVLATLPCKNFVLYSGSREFHLMVP